MNKNSVKPRNASLYDNLTFSATLWSNFYLPRHDGRHLRISPQPSPSEKKIQQSRDPTPKLSPKPIRFRKTVLAATRLTEGDVMGEKVERSGRGKREGWRWGDQQKAHAKTTGVGK